MIPLAKVAFISSARFTQPLDSTAQSKFQALAALGEVFVVGFSTAAYPRKFAAGAHFYLLPLVPFPLLRYALLLAAGTLLSLWLVVRHDVTVLVAQGPYHGLTSGWTKALSRLFGKQVAVVIESHGDFQQSLFMERRVRLPALYRTVMRWSSRYVLQCADALRAVSTQTCDQLRGLAPQTPLVQFPAWTDMQVFLQAGAGRQAKRDAAIILYVGALTPLKGVECLLDAFHSIARGVPAARLILIGAAREAGYARALAEKAQRLGVADRVDWRGVLPQRDVAQTMAQASVLVLPSFSEGLGRVVFEAMACGTPVIGTQVGGIPDMIRPGENGFLVPPGDQSALGERLLWILQHPEAAREMGARGREFARTFFSPEAYVAHYAHLLQLATTASAARHPRRG